MSMQTNPYPFDPIRLQPLLKLIGPDIIADLEINKYGFEPTINFCTDNGHHYCNTCCKLIADAHIDLEILFSENADYTNEHCDGCGKEYTPYPFVGGLNYLYDRDNHEKDGYDFYNLCDVAWAVTNDKEQWQRDELEQALQQANQPQPASQPQTEVKLVKKGD